MFVCSGLEHHTTNPSRRLAPVTSWRRESTFATTRRPAITLTRLKTTGSKRLSTPVVPVSLPPLSADVWARQVTTQNSHVLSRVLLKNEATGLSRPRQKLGIHVRFSVHYLYYASSTMQRPTSLGLGLALGLGLGLWWGIGLAVGLVVAWYSMCGVSMEH